MRDLRAVVRAWVVEDPGLKLLSLLLAFGAWWWVQGQQVTTEPVRIVLDWRLPDGLVATTPPPTSATAIVQGPRSVIRRARLVRPTIVVDLEEEAAGSHDVSLASYGIDRLPPGLTVLTFTPETETVRLGKRVKRKLPVQPVWIGKPGATHGVREVVVVPDVVEVAGPRDVVSELSGVSTVPVDVSGWTAGRTIDVALDLPSTLATTEPWAGKVTVTIDAVVGEQTIQGVPVVVWGREDWRPVDGAETLTVTLRGPTDVLRSLRVDHVLARVEVPAETSADRLVATYQAAQSPRLEIVVPRPDVVEVVGTPGPVRLERR